MSHSYYNRLCVRLQYLFTWVLNVTVLIIEREMLRADPDLRTDRGTHELSKRFRVWMAPALQEDIQYSGTA
jgi:hypothetical protein